MYFLGDSICLTICHKRPYECPLLYSLWNRPCPVLTTLILLMKHPRTKHYILLPIVRFGGCSLPTLVCCQPGASSSLNCSHSLCVVAQLHLREDICARIPRQDFPLVHCLSGALDHLDSINASFVFSNGSRLYLQI